MKLVSFLSGLIAVFVILTHLHLNANEPQFPRSALAPTEVLNKVEGVEYRYSGKGILPGYYSTNTCIYASKDTAILVHYCQSPRPLPAKALTVVSKKIGFHHLYFEDLGQQLKRDIVIQVFPEDLNVFDGREFDQLSFNDWSLVYKKLQNKSGPGCWATNYSFYTRGPDIGCYREKVERFPEWSSESISVTGAMNDWQKYYDSIIAQIQNNL